MTDWQLISPVINHAMFPVLQFSSVLSMVRIREVVQQALSAGYLTVAAENQLRQLLQTKYDREDLNAFMRLQEATMAGRVRQESRELRQSEVTWTPTRQSSPSYSFCINGKKKTDK
jgi:hypothetical protein